MGNRSSTRVGGGARVVRLGPRASQGRACRVRRRLVVRGGDLSCEVETSRARRRLVVGDFSSGELSEMHPTGRRLDVLPAWVLTSVLSPPYPESLPSTLSILTFTLSMMLDCLVVLGEIISPSKGALIRALVSRPPGDEAVRPLPGGASTRCATSAAYSAQVSYPFASYNYFPLQIFNCQ
jgi:hypothetical protein